MTAKGKRKPADVPVLTREQILAGYTNRPEPIDLPGFGGIVYAREMTAGERAEFEDRYAPEDGEESAGDRVRRIVGMMVMTLCDADGRLLFGHDDVAALSASLPAKTVLHVGVKLAARNSIGAAEIEDAEGN